jgi:hypothetical protein
LQSPHEVGFHKVIRVFLRGVAADNILGIVIQNDVVSDFGMLVKPSLNLATASVFGLCSWICVLPYWNQRQVALIDVAVLTAA